MHTGSVSHLGIVVLPPLLAIAQQQRVDGRSFAAAAIVGYEVGGRIGRAIVTPEFAQTPCLAAVALAKDKGFDPSEIVSVDVSASRAAKAIPVATIPARSRASFRGR